MRAKITRTMTQTTITGVTLELKDKNPVTTELAPIVVNGVVKDAVKELKNAYGKDKNYAVLEVKEEEKVYEISVEDFLKYAKEVKKEESTEDKPEVKE
jgi:hypothetical protein